MAFELISEYFGPSYANYDVLIEEESTGNPATILNSINGGVKTTDGIATINLQGNLDVIINTDISYVFTILGVNSAKPLKPAFIAVSALDEVDVVDGFGDSYLKGSRGSLIQSSNFASGIEPITLVTSIPNTKSTSVIFNTTDGTLYRWNGTAYVAQVLASEISGILSDAQLAGIAASKITGQLTSDQLAYIAAAKITGQITSTQITDGAISTPKLAAGSVTTAAIAAGSVVSESIAAGAVTTASLAAGAIVSTKIAAGTIQASNIAAGTITGDLIQANTISSSNLASDSVVAGKIAAGAINVGSAAIQDGAIRNAMIENLSASKLTAGSLSVGQYIQSSNYIPGTSGWIWKADGSGEIGSLIIRDVLTLQNSQISISSSGVLMGAGGGSVNIGQLPGYITPTQFASNIEPVSIVSSVPGVKSTNTIFNTTDGKLYRWNSTSYTAAIQAIDISGTLSAGNIASGSMDITKFAAGLEPVSIVTSVPLTKSTSVIFNSTDGKTYRWNGVTYTAVVPSTDISGTLTDAQLTAVSASKITGQLTSAQVLSLDAAKLTSQITSTQISDGAISTPKLQAGAITANEIAGNTITASKIASGTITSTQIQAGSILSASIGAGEIKAVNIAADSITASKVLAGSITGDRLLANTITAGQIQAGAIGVNQLAAGSITASKLAITDMTNLCTSGTGVTADGWSTGSGVVASSGNVWGSNASTGVSLLFQSRDAVFGQAFSVIPDDQFWVSMDCVPEGGGASAYQFILGLMIRDSSGTVTSWMNGAIRDVGVSGFQTISGSITIPAGAATAQIWCAITGPSSTIFTGAGKPHYATNIVVRRKNAGSLLVDGAITAAKISAGAVTTASMAANTIQGDRILTNSLDAAKITSNSITSGQIQAGAISATEIAAGAITTGKLLISSAGNSLTPDVDLIDASAWGVASGSPSFGYAISDGAAGPTCLYAVGSCEIYSKKRIAIVPNTRYQVSIWIKGTGPGVFYLRLMCFNAAGTMTGYTLTGLSPVTTTLEGIATPTTWAQYIGYTDTPVGSIQAEIHLHTNWSGGGTSYVQKLTCQQYIPGNIIVDGSITANKINARGLSILDSNGNVILSAGNTLASQVSPSAIGAISTNLSNAPGGILNSNIAIASNGTLSGAGGGQVTLPGMGQNQFRLIARGGSCTATTDSAGLWINGTYSYGIGRSYLMARIRRTDGAVLFQRSYDVYGVGASGGYTATDLANDLNGSGTDVVVVLVTTDEPMTNRLTGGLAAAVYRCGGSSAIFGSSNFMYRSAYILVGIPGCGEGNGAEAYQGSVSSDTNAWCELSFSLLNSAITGVSANYTPRTLTDYGYVGALDANKTYVDGSGLIQGVSSGAGTPVQNSLLTSSITAAGTTATWTGVSGSGKPADNATVGATWGSNLSGQPADSALLNSYVNIGQNLIPNSDQKQQINWTKADNYAGATYDIVLSWADTIWSTTSYGLAGGISRNVVLHQSNNTGGGDAQGLTDVYPMGAYDYAHGIPVVPGQRYCFSYYVQTHRCNAGAGFYFWNSSGAQMGVGNEVDNITPPNNGGGAADLGSYYRVTVFATAPAGAVVATPFMRKNNTWVGQGESYWWAACPQFEAVNANTTSPSPYVSGPPLSLANLGYTGDKNATYGAAFGLNISGQINSGNASTYIASAAINSAMIDSIDAGTITTGQLRGINIQGSHILTSGTTVLSPAVNGQTYLNVGNTSDFPASGVAAILDATNQLQTITYTSKTANTLVLADTIGGPSTSYMGVTVGSSISPHTGAVVLNRASNTLVVLSSPYGALSNEIVPTKNVVIGLPSTAPSSNAWITAGTLVQDSVRPLIDGISGFSRLGVGVRGTSNTIGIEAVGSGSSGTGLHAVSYGGGTAIVASSSTGPGVSVTSPAVGIMVNCSSTGTGIGITTTTGSHIIMTPLAAMPAVNPGAVAMLYTTGGAAGARTATPRLCFSDGSNWMFISSNAVFTG